MERIAYVCMDVAPVNNKSEGLCLRQEIECGTPGRREKRRTQRKGPKMKYSIVGRGNCRVHLQ